MRLSLGGSNATNQPAVLTLTNGVPFLAEDYIALGYTNFDVICIGGGGGRGGGVTSGITYSSQPMFINGGGGGGGGLHRIKGKLINLPRSVAVVVGVGGTNAANVAAGATPSAGTDGGYSSFNGTTCRASGGKGGLAVAGSTTHTTPPGAGGAGGTGGSIIAGGGAVGGAAGVFVPGGSSTHSSPGANGTWDETIGKGGGGGGGGVGEWAGTMRVLANSGGHGSYNNNSISVYGSGQSATQLLSPPSLYIANAVGGYGGGAKAYPLNALQTEWGSKRGASSDSAVFTSGNGAVIIRLT